MKVVAVKLAFYNGSRVRPGDELDVPDTLKGSWFVASEQAVKPVTKRQSKTLSEEGKQAATTFIEANASEG